MMKHVLMFSVGFLLVSCGGREDLGSVGDLPEVEAVQMPALSGKLAEKAERLPDITSGEPQAQQLDGAATDMAYNSVANRLNALIDLYGCVREAMNSRDSSKMKKCGEGMAE